jgi:hypothetical protein
MPRSKVSKLDHRRTSSDTRTINTTIRAPSGIALGALWLFRARKNTVHRELLDMKAHKEMLNGLREEEPTSIAGAKLSLAQVNRYL